MTATAPDLDVPGLESYLEARLSVEVVDTEVLHDGLNLSVAISTAEAERYVLRRPNKLRELDSFNDVDEEFGVMGRLRETPVPAPEPILLCEDESVLDDQFLVMTHLDGEPVTLGSDLPERWQHPTAREQVAASLIDTLADLHTVDVDPFTDVCARRPIQEAVAEIVEQFETATSATGHEPPALRDVADWLERNAPSEARTALVHGDYRPGNVLFEGADTPDITGVLDWETAFLGDPLTELGYFLLRWRDDGDPTPSLDGIEARYATDDAIQTLRDRNERGLAPFTDEPGSPTRRDLVARYEDRTGIEFEHERFYRAFAAFTLAAVWENLHRHRLAAGGDSEWEPHIDYMLLVADSIADGNFGL
ncbi:phosphotransferase family protein [Halobacteriales archaeon QS_1_67_19]|nr:MAG: phosphotransferase family protein [Halobacteriales archaeon QS_1_67_19]